MSVARNTLVQSSLTLASRVLGMVRDILLVARIGAGPVGDAWATAQQFPNLFRRVFAEGAFASAFVPTYARTLESEGAEAARVVAQEAMRVLFAATAALTILAQVFMPWVLLLIHGGQADDAVHYDLAVFLTRITMPYLTFMALGALLSGVLNSSERFILSAGVPTILNLCLIPAAFVSTDPVLTAKAASIAYFVAGMLQAGALWWGGGLQSFRACHGRRVRWTRNPAAQPWMKVSAWPWR